MTGWHGHARPFDFTVDYAPAPGIERFRVGTPQLLSVAGLEASLDIWDDVDMEAVREKSLRLTELFMSLVDTRLTPHWGIEPVTPRESVRRGSQVSLPPRRRLRGDAGLDQSAGSSATSGRPTSSASASRRSTPHMPTCGDAVDVLEDVLRTEIWREPRFARRGTVT